MYSPSKEAETLTPLLKNLLLNESLRYTDSTPLPKAIQLNQFKLKLKLSPMVVLLNITDMDVVTPIPKDSFTLNVNTSPSGVLKLSFSEFPPKFM